MKKFMCSILLILVFASCSFGVKKGNVQKVDFDLTKFSSVMVYSGLYNILSNPSEYVGQVIKIKGYFDLFHDNETGKDYFGVVIMDSSACCSTGLDFVLRDEYKYPKDYPEVGETITVAGKFEMYRDGDEVFCHLVDADIL